MSFYIYEGGGLTPKLQAILDTDKYSTNSFKVLSANGNHKVNDTSTIEIVIPADHPDCSLITNTSDVVFIDTYGNPQEYHIADIEDYHSVSIKRTLYCEHSSIELIDSLITSAISTTDATSTNPAVYLAYILSFTRWSVGTVDSNIYNSRMDVSDFVGKNCLEALQLLLNKYNCEVEYTFTMTNNVITGRIVNLKAQIGQSIGKRFEYTKDINSVKRSIDTSGVKTAIFPRSAIQSEGENSETTYITIADVSWNTASGNPVNKPLGDVVLVNTNIDNIYRRLDSASGTLIDRLMYAEWTQETADNSTTLLSQAWAILSAAGVPSIKYEVEAEDLYLLTGDETLTHEHVGLGDTVAIIDRAFATPLEVSSRIEEMEEDYLDPQNNKYVLGTARETLATSNVNQQLSVEEQLQALKKQVRGISVSNPYQGGISYYESLREAVQSEFVQSSGYTFISDDEGLWVFDMPQEGNPTKATIIKGGCIAVAQYNTTTSTWNVGTFINGTSINADMINTGTLNADRIGAGSITTNHLAATAVNYIRTGMATEEDLNGVVADIESMQDDISTIQTNYATTSAMDTAISDATDTTLTEAKKATILDVQRQLQSEYNKTIAQANTVYADSYLPTGEVKTALNNKRTAYTTAYNNYNNYITSMLSDSTITTAEYNQYVSYSTAYATAIKELATAIENANSTRLTAVYSAARQGLVTTAELEVNNESVIASAKQGMVSTGDMTAAINTATNDLVNTASMNSAVNTAVNNIVVGSTNRALKTAVPFTMTFTNVNNQTANMYKIAMDIANNACVIAFDYVLADVVLSTSNTSTLKFQGHYRDANNADIWGPSKDISIPAGSSSGKVQFTYTFGELYPGYKPEFRFRADYMSGSMTVSNAQVVIGTKKGSWSPAPEDDVSAVTAIQEAYKSITAEYNYNHNSANTLLSNSYLTGSSLNSLQSALYNYDADYQDVTTAVTNIVAADVLTSPLKTAYNTAITELQGTATILGTRMNEAITSINTAVYNASKSYTDGKVADSLTGMASETYVNNAMSQAIEDAQEGMVSTSDLQVNTNEILMTNASMGQNNLLYNTDFRDSTNHWTSWGVDNTSYGTTTFTATYGDIRCMSGERAAMIHLIGASDSGSCSIGMYQDVTLDVGLSYTFSYWLNAVGTTCGVTIEFIRSSDSVRTTVASKSYANTNAYHNRASWEYDAITFTTGQEAGVYRFVFSINSYVSGGGKLMVTKPMLCTGIYAQPWSGHPSEIYVGVVSVTEERGIMVEHNGSNTYSTLDTNGIKVWEYNNTTPLASFGEGNSARISTVEADRIISPNLMPVIWLSASQYIYCSNTGSGALHGGDASNCACGFSGAMARLCRNTGLPEECNGGGFIINGDYTIHIFVYGTVFDEDIVLGHVYGNAQIFIEFMPTVVATGRVLFYDIKNPLILSGDRSGNSVNDGAIIKRTSATDGARFYQCEYAQCINMRFNGAGQSAIVADRGTNLMVSACDVYGYKHGLWAGALSRVHVANFRGTVTGTDYGMKASSALLICAGQVPNASLDTGTAGALIQGDSGYTKTASMQGSSSTATSQTVNVSFSASKYESVRSYTISDLYQSCWSSDASYGSYVGRIYFGNLKSWMTGATNMSATIYLQRQSSSHGNYTGSTVYINSTYVGTLDLGQGKWFTVPSSVLTGLQSGSLSYISLNGTGTNSYIKFEKNAVIRVTATKSV